MSTQVKNVIKILYIINVIRIYLYFLSIYWFNPWLPKQLFQYMYLVCINKTYRILINASNKKKTLLNFRIIQKSKKNVWGHFGEQVTLTQSTVYFNTKLYLIPQLKITQNAVHEMFREFKKCSLEMYHVGNHRKSHWCLQW